MSTPRKHHYLPQFFLRGFASSRDQVWMFDSEATRHSHVAVKDAAAQRDLYSVPEIDGSVDHKSLEQRFSAEIETPAAPVLALVCNRSSLGKSEKEILCKLIYTLYSRVPSGLARLKARSPRLAKQVLGDAIARIDPSLNDATRSEMIRVGAEIAEFQAENPPKEAMLPLEHGRVVPHLMAMRFVFVTVATGLQFVTSDSPLAFDTSVGLSRSDFTIALSTDLALIGTHNRSVIDLTYHQVAASIGRELNHRTARNSSRYVYSCSKQAWLNSASAASVVIRRSMWP